MIELENVQKVFNKGDNKECVALSGASLTIEQGDMVAIIGTSGAGKSTLLKVISGMLKIDGGKYLFHKEDTGKFSKKQWAEERNQNIGFVTQDYCLIEEMSVIENVILPTLFCKGTIKSARNHAKELLEKVNMEEYLEKQVSYLSGGQKQRVAIARALMNSPRLILADEPTGALDEKNTMEIMNLLKKLNEEGQTVVVVTHDPIVSKCCKKIVTISDGKVNEQSVSTANIR